MTRPLLRELMDLARESGYAATSCPSCGIGAGESERSSACGNCGGSGRLWTSRRGSLSDDGLLRLARLLGHDVATGG